MNELKVKWPTTVGLVCLCAHVFITFFQGSENNVTLIRIKLRLDTFSCHCYWLMLRTRGSELCWNDSQVY